MSVGSVPLRQALMSRVKLTVAASFLLGMVGLGISPAGGPSAALLDVALLGLASLWLSRSPTAAPSPAAGRGVAMSGNQALLLVLAVGGAAVLVASGSASRPLHGLSVAPFAMVAFALSSQNSRDLRSGVLAELAALLVLSAADDSAPVMVLCVAGLVPLVFGWIAVRQLMALDQYPATTPSVNVAGPRPWSAGLVARLVVLTAAAALLLPTEPAPRLHAGDGAAADQGRDSSTQDGQRGDEIGAADGQLDLRDRGNLDSTPVLEVPAASPTLWQGGYVDFYDGSGWTRTINSDPQDSTYRTMPLTGGLPVGNGLTVSTVTRLQPTGQLVYAPGPVIGVDAAAGRLFDLGTGSLAVYDSENPLEPYTVAWAPPGSSVTDSETATLPPVSDPRWVQVPAGLPARISDLARTVTAGAATTEATVSAIEDYLRTHEKYELDSPVPPQGTDVVDAFLFSEHVGFCEQFASAETMMLRTLGVPARVATGYGGEGVVSPDGTRRTYRNQDAHAWVQVGYPGQRWVDSDPTAGSQLAPASLRHRLVAWLTKVWHDLTDSVAARALVAAGLVGTALLCWAAALLVRRLVRRRRGREAMRGPAPRQPYSPAGLAYQRLLVRLLEQGRPRMPTETVRDLLFRLRAEDREVVVGLLEAQWYGPPASVPDHVMARVVAILDALAQQPQPVGAASP